MKIIVHKLSLKSQYHGCMQNFYSTGHRGVFREFCYVNLKEIWFFRKGGGVRTHSISHLLRSAWHSEIFVIYMCICNIIVVRILMEFKMWVLNIFKKNEIMFMNQILSCWIKICLKNPSKSVIESLSVDLSLSLSLCKQN